MSKKTLIILLVIIAIGIVVIMVAGRGAEVPSELEDEILPVDDPAVMEPDEDVFPVEDEVVEPDEDVDPVEDEEVENGEDEELE